METTVGCYYLDRKKVWNFWLAVLIGSWMGRLILRYNSLVLGQDPPDLVPRTRSLRTRFPHGKDPPGQDPPMDNTPRTRSPMDKIPHGQDPTMDKVTSDKVPTWTRYLRTGSPFGQDPPGYDNYTPDNYSLNKI